jgi:hypothetical protein
MDLPKNWHFYHVPKCDENYCAKGCPVFNYRTGSGWKNPEVVKKWKIIYRSTSTLSLFKIDVYRAEKRGIMLLYELRFRIDNITLAAARELDKDLRGTVSLKDKENV